MASYERINWEDSPSRLTPINADNLNTMDAGLAALVDEFNGYISGENERIAELNDIKDQLEARIDALCEVPNIEKVREYIETDGYKIPSVRESVKEEVLDLLQPKAIPTSDFIQMEWISPNRLDIASNSSFTIGNTVHLNLKFDWNFDMNTGGNTLNLCYVPLDLKPPSEVSIVINDNANAGGHFEGWIRSTGELVVISRGTVTGIRQMRVCGSYILPSS